MGWSVIFTELLGNPGQRFSLEVALQYCFSRQAIFVFIFIGVTQLRDKHLGMDLLACHTVSLSKTQTQWIKKCMRRSNLKSTLTYTICEYRICLSKIFLNTVCASIGMCTFTSAESVNFRLGQKYTEKVGSGLYDKDDYGKNETWSIQEVPSRRETKDTSVLKSLKKTLIKMAMYFAVP